MEIKLLLCTLINYGYRIEHFCGNVAHCTVHMFGGFDSQICVYEYNVITESLNCILMNCFLLFKKKISVHLTHHKLKIELKIS